MKKRKDKVFMEKAVRKDNFHAIMANIEKLVGCKIGLGLVESDKRFEYDDLDKKEDGEEGEAFSQQIDLVFHVPHCILRIEANDIGNTITVPYATSRYADSAIKFKLNRSMSIDDFAWWLRLDKDIVEYECCKALVKKLNEENQWRIWNGSNWITIDPYEFLVKCDLASDLS